MNRFNWCILIFFLSSYYLVFILDFEQIINSVNDNSVRTLVLYHHYKNSFLASFHYFLLLRAKWKPRFIIVILIFCQFTPVHAPENVENAPAQVLTQLRYCSITCYIHIIMWIYFFYVLQLFLLFLILGNKRAEEENQKRVAFVPVFFWFSSFPLLLSIYFLPSSDSLFTFSFNVA